jgi:hypothetical protein
MRGMDGTEDAYLSLRGARAAFERPSSGAPRRETLAPRAVVDQILSLCVMEFGRTGSPCDVPVRRSIAAAVRWEQSQRVVRKVATPEHTSRGCCQIATICARIDVVAVRRIVAQVPFGDISGQVQLTPTPGSQRGKRSRAERPDSPNPYGQYTRHRPQRSQDQAAHLVTHGQVASLRRRPASERGAA